FLLGAVASSEAAARELRGRWCFPVEAGEVKFLRRHDRVMGTVSKGGRTILDCALVDPQPVSGSDVQYINWVTAANAPLDGTTQPMLIQVDPKYTFHKAERGKPQVSVFDAAAWNAGGVTLADPIVGTCSTVDTDLPRIRFVMDPLKPVFQGTRRIRESRAEE
ncbi:MAG: acetoacetate decarboxylase family protein, partial [Reyranella sp.]|nr:acetoacetate decarboxylase family protein [Reyranella sp.]